MLATYIYNSCFVLEYEKFTVIIDFFKDSAGLEEKGFINDYLSNTQKKLYVLCSHSHLDHFNKKILKWNNKDIVYIFSSDVDIYNIDNKNINYLKKGDVYKDENISVKAYGSTDLGVSFLFDVGSHKYFHAGDLNNWHWNMEVSKETADMYEKRYLRELEEISNDVNHIDFIMFPLDPRLGKDFARGALQFVEKINVSVFAPMHFAGDFRTIDEAFNIFEHSDVKYIKWSKYGQSVTI